MTARVRLPKDAKRGETIHVRLLIQHAMETGYRLGADGQKVAKNVIRSLVCRYNGVEVFRAEMSPGIAANPYLEFPVVATESGRLEFNWVDDSGERGSVTEAITVVG
jgi:sulfur-oxidizing protein SoxZ